MDKEQIMEYKYIPIPKRIKDVIWIRLIKKDGGNRWCKNLPSNMNIGDITWVTREDFINNMCLFENNKYCGNFPSEWFEEVNQNIYYEIY